VGLGPMCPDQAAQPTVPSVMKLMIACVPRKCEYRVFQKR